MISNPIYQIYQLLVALGVLQIAAGFVLPVLQKYSKVYQSDFVQLHLVAVRQFESQFLQLP